MKKEEVITFIKECIILFAFLLSAFWIIATGVELIPQITEAASEGGLLPLFYSLGTICFAAIVGYIGLKYVTNKKVDD